MKLRILTFLMMISSAILFGCSRYENNITNNGNYTMENVVLKGFGQHRNLGNILPGQSLETVIYMNQDGGWLVEYDILNQHYIQETGYFMKDDIVFCEYIFQRSLMTSNCNNAL